ncbi:NAD(P)H-dependent oxidoreductase, partial [Photobacterium sp. OFAV2-7]|uniref:NAD(P)H-dependent oxidoreductase n=1 Tax=Photobacterium sp. OFAV2-7 TaxID=2917748 RepID=UPI001EF667DF
MRVLIVFNHPYEMSFCNAILKAVKRGLDEGNHDIDLIHLDNDNFDPVMRGKDLQAFALARTDPERSQQLLDEQVLDYKQRIERADHIVFIFPIWWELMPALTKGFIDKLIFPGIAYDYNSKGTRMFSKLDKLKGVTMITTMNTPSIAYRLLFGNAIKKALLLGTFWKIG